MRKFSEYALKTIDEVQAIHQEFLSRNPGGSDEAAARLTDTASRMIYDAAEDVFDD